MIKKILILAIIGLFEISIITACRPSEKKEEGSKENVSESEIAAKAKEEWIQFKSEAEVRINNNKEQLAILKEKMVTTDLKVRVEANKMVDQLEQKNNELNKNLTEYKEEGVEKWMKFKEEFNHDMDELVKAIKDLTVQNIK
ncbi:MAG: hypothetical protein A3F72_10160 [Bacteroidetes bacterium RIFCSPLOWO2_12_FULL_35_15]|nr:MAG: hypothetical protein A3F72_10160 [Bacteroidetes bacterium RIFCSPLOWO2_12_FULL_35_15]